MTDRSNTFRKSSTAVGICSATRLIAEGYLADNSSKFNDGVDGDGHHAGERTKFWGIQIILNVMCNQLMNHRDASCCQDVEPISRTQRVTGYLLTFRWVAKPNKIADQINS